MLDVIRAAVLGSYGVAGFADRDLLSRLVRRIGLGRPSIELGLEDGIRIDLHVTVAHGLPVAEVARQVESAVRYAVRHAFGREVARLVVHVNGLRVLPHGSVPARHGDDIEARDPARPVELRASRMRTALRRRAAGNRSSTR
jgi:uncharacterized alkaline shock family protein YloU